MQLILGDYIKKNSDMLCQLSQATEIINWFNNHSQALHTLYAEQHTIPELSHWALSLIWPVIT